MLGCSSCCVVLFSLKLYWETGIDAQKCDSYIGKKVLHTCTQGYEGPNFPKFWGTPSLMTVKSVADTDCVSARLLSQSVIQTQFCCHYVLDDAKDGWNKYGENKLKRQTTECKHFWEFLFYQFCRKHYEVRPMIWKSFKFCDLPDSWICKQTTFCVLFFVSSEPCSFSQ